MPNWASVDLSKHNLFQVSHWLPFTTKFFIVFSMFRELTFFHLGNPEMTKWPILGCQMALQVPKSKFWDHFYWPKLPPKPPFRPSRNPNRTSKSDFWPFYWFLPFSHWNSHCNRKKLRTAEGVVLQQKQKVFRNLWTKWNNMKPCRSWINQIFVIRITLLL